jgi:putative transposase
MQRQEHANPPDFGKTRLDALQRHAFDYFLHETNHTNGLVADMSRPGAPASIAAVGFNQLRHPAYRKPELLATGPNQVWSWDITKLLGPVKWTYYYLYVLLDIFSRYVVGWLLARQEAAALAKVLIAESCERQHIGRDQLTIHADRGPSMTSQPVALLLATLGVVPSHSRPQVSDDNPFSEAQFKTLKYRPDFPARFGAHEDAEAFCQRFFPWYNTEHWHSALGLMTPHDIHYGLSVPMVEVQRTPK